MNSQLVNGIKNSHEGKRIENTALIKSVIYSMFSPLLIGILIGLYYVLTLENATSQIFYNIIMTAVSNAHIVGLTMGCFVVPGYLLLYKLNKITYWAILTISLLGGALFSFIFSASGSMVFLVNTLMSLTAAGIFLNCLRRFTK